MTRKKTGRKTTIKRRSVEPKKKSRTLEMAIVAIFALVVIYAASFAIRITHGISKTIDEPQYTIRIQVLNGCGVDGAASRVADQLPTIVGLPLEIIVVDVDDFKSYHVKESFLISRDKDLRPLKIMANQLGIENKEIEFVPIENNYRSISATLVLGEDYQEIISIRSNKGE